MIIIFYKIITKINKNEYNSKNILKKYDKYTYTYQIFHITKII